MNEAWLLLDKRQERLKMAFCYGSSHDVILNVTKIRNLYKINVMLFVQWWNIQEVVLYIRRKNIREVLIIHESKTIWLGLSGTEGF